MFRGTHLKTQGCVKGTFTIKEGLPDHLKQGMFETPGDLSDYSFHLEDKADLTQTDRNSRRDHALQVRSPVAAADLSAYTLLHGSSLTPKVLPDTAGAPRGLGMKIFGVKGPKIWGEDKETQDWTFNNYPLRAFASHLAII